MIKRNSIDLDEIGDGILWRLHKALAENDAKPHKISSLARDLHITPNLLSLAIEKLENNEYCTTTSEEEFFDHPVTGNLTSVPEAYVELTSKGFSIVQEWANEKYRQVLGRYGDHEDAIEWDEDNLEEDLDDNPEALFDVVYDDEATAANDFIPIVAVPSQAPASDRTVTPTDNQRDDAAKALEDFIKEFRQDHHFGNEWVAEKNALLKILEAGKDYLGNKVIEVRIGTMMTIEPLKEVVAKYDQTAVGGTVSAMAQKLIEFLINLFAG